MKYLVTSEWDIDTDDLFEEFKKFVSTHDFDKLVFAGDIASYRYAPKIADWLEEQGYDFVYIAGNTERGFGGPSTVIGGWHLEHGHRFDPFYYLPGVLRYSKNPIKSLYLKFRGLVKSMYGEDPKYEGEQVRSVLADNSSKYSSFFKRLFIRLISQRLPKYSMIAHFHMFSGEAYSIGDKKLRFLESYPDYFVFETSED